MMRICIWYKITESPWGGSNSFLRALTQEFKRMGHEVTHRISRNNDIVLVNSWSRGEGRYLNINQVRKQMHGGIPSVLSRILPELFQKKYLNNRKPIVHRLNGIAMLYGRADPHADNIQFSIANLADLTIFQSYYSQKSFEEFNIFPENYEIIHNAVDGKIFHPKKQSGMIGSTLKILAVSWSANPMKGFSYLPCLANIPNVEVSFIGNWCTTIKPGNVNLLGIKTSTEIAGFMRESDVLVHPAFNDPCSNVILEGLACGLPVLYNDSGGNRELAGEFGLPLQGELEEVVENLRLNYKELKQKVLDSRQKFLIESAANKYLASFHKFIERFHEGK